MKILSIKQARIEAKKLLKKYPGVYPELRSCWNCNGAHEHLKEHDLIMCFGCGHWYYKGIDITITNLTNKS